MEIGHAIKVCRSSRKLSLGEVSSRSGLSQSYLSLIETGKRAPTLESIEKLSRALAVPTPVLMFLAAKEGELQGLDVETSRLLSAAVLNVLRA
jgi:transcriptional regulator with XRE-family HTH domain